MTILSSYSGMLGRNSRLRSNSLRLVHSPSFATAVGMASRALAVLLVSPLVLALYTPEKSAVWMLLITLFGLQMLIEASVSMTFYRAIGLARGGAKNVKRSKSMQRKSLRTRDPNTGLLTQVWQIMGIAYPATAVVTVTLLGAMAAFSYPSLVSQLENPALQLEAYGALAVFLLSIAARMYVGRHISYLHASGRIPTMRWAEAIYTTLAFVASILVLVVGGGLFALALAFNIPLMFGFAFQTWLCSRALAEDSIPAPSHEGTAASTIAWDLWSQFWRAGLGTALFLITTQGAGFYYARFGSPSDVAAYLFAMSLLRPMMQFAQIPFFTKLPYFSELQAQGSVSQQSALAQKSMRQSLIILCMLILVVALMIAFFQSSDVFDLNLPSELWALIGLAAFAERIGAMHLQFYSSTNHIVWHWANGFAAVLFVFFAAFFLDRLGLLAFPLSHLLAMCIFYTPFSMFLSYRAFQLRWPDYELRTTALPLAVLLVYAFLVFAGESR